MSYSRMSRFTASTAEGFFKFKKMVFLLRPSQAAAAVVPEPSISGGQWTTRSYLSRPLTLRTSAPRSASSRVA